MPPIEKLIADFDGTVSEVDTLGLLVQNAAKHRATGGDMGAQPSFLEWRETVEWYSKQHARIVNEWLTNDSGGTTGTEDNLEVHPDLAGLRRFLDAAEVLEYDATHRVIERKFLSGLTKETLRKIGRCVQLRSGVFTLMEAMRANGVKIEILSANWSKTFIQGAMGEMCDQIVTNSLIFDKSGRSTGEIHLRVISAQDKLKHFLRRKSHRNQFTPSQDVKEQYRKLQPRIGRTLYIGDSVTDLLAILEADVGVLIGTKQTAVQAMKRFGIPTREITGKDRFGSVRDVSRTVLRVDSWETLGHFLGYEKS
ncbi:MAG: haloacid dehalogenase-like hydrolase [Candidatus Poribacteria bacterium]|nr:haloacid dehalogenase-like hydrolase [Candidatus Poribacteria bacterium]